MVPSWLRQASVLNILLLSEGNVWACSTTPPLELNCQHPKASGCPWETEKGETYLVLLTEQGTLPLLSNAGLCSMLVWIPGLSKTQRPWGFPGDVVVLAAAGCSA